MSDLIELIRVEKAEDLTYGVLKAGGKTHGLILERAWLGNKPNISCIPEGVYLCERVLSPKFGDTFEVLNVPGRTHILFHSGNTVDDSLGCLLLGKGMGVLKGKRGVVSSRIARDEFMKLMKGKNHFPLQIKKI